MERFATFRFQLTCRLPDDSPDRAALAKAFEASGARLIDGCPVPPGQVLIEFRQAAGDSSQALVEALRILRRQLPGAEVVASSAVVPAR